MANKPTTIDYQKLSAELDAILLELETEDFDVDKAIKQYERGMSIVKQLKDYLKQSQNKVTKLKNKFSD